MECPGTMCRRLACRPTPFLGMLTRLVRGTLMSAVLLAVCAFTASGQQKFAVFVGVNDYVEFGDEPGGDLQGAESDAILMRQVLVERWGLAEENTLMLLSLEATKEAIRQAITGWLAEKAGPDDLAIFYFAGHGSQVYDLDGDEPDGLDETLAPTDVLQLSSVNDIRDDEFRVWLSSVGTEVVVILDSCHSGTATRGGSEMRTRSLERPIPPEDGNEPEFVRQAYDPESMADGATTILELAAAAPNQSALEGPFGATGTKAAEPRGAFTWFLVQELARAEPDITYEEVIRSVAERLFEEELPQDPQVTGAGTRAIFRPG
jgi:caspase domain-containing protein